MVTRIRIEAEGRTSAEVEDILNSAAELFDGRAPMAWTGPGLQPPMSTGLAGAAQVAFGPQGEALSDRQAGEMVIERFAKDLKGGDNHGAVFFRGRATTHYAPRTSELDLRNRQPGGG